VDMGGWTKVHSNGGRRAPGILREKLGEKEENSSEEEVSWGRCVEKPYYKFKVTNSRRKGGSLYQGLRESE